MKCILTPEASRNNAPNIPKCWLMLYKKLTPVIPGCTELALT